MRSSISCICSLFTLVFFSSYAFAQSYNISGYVYDADSKESLIGAYIFLNDSVPAAVTNNYGYFSVPVKNSENKIKCHYIGYQDTSYSLTVNTDTRADFYLRTNELQTVIINSDNILRDRINTIPFTISELKSITQIGGEPDLMKAMSMSPGISTAGEGLSKLIVRGGEVDQNLIRLDGATVYNTSHLFGFVSIFNPDAIKSVTVYKGGFPAKYGGRLSSVIDFNMYEGNKAARKATLSIGTITSHYLLEGPMKKNTASYMLSARSSYLGLFVLPLKYAFLKEMTDGYTNYWMYDVNGKVNFPIAKKGRMFLSLYTGKDYYYRVSKFSETEYPNNIASWGNITADARYTTELNPKLFLVAGLSFTNYKSAYTQKIFSDPLLSKFVNSTEQTSAINDLNLNVDLSVSAAKNDAINFGVEVNTISFVPIKYSTKPVDTIGYIYLNSEIGNANVLYNAAYIENVWQINNNVELITGLRQVMYINNDFIRNNTEPRIVYNYSPDNEYTISASYSLMHQYVNLLAATQVGFQEEFYVPSDSLLSASVADVYSLGFNRNLFKNKYYFSAEAYYKNMAGLIAIKPGVTSVLNNFSQIDDITASNGRGLAYGAEFLFKKETGNFTGWLEYTLSWNNRKFSDINNNEWFPSAHDRRHDFGITGAYKFNDKWNMSATWVYVTGQPLTVPDAIYQDPYGYYYFHIPSINNGKLPDYHRLDFSFTRNKLTKNQNNSAWSFGIYNAYGRINPVYADYVLKETKDADGNVTHVEAILRTTTLFRFLPFVTYSLKFNNERKYY